MAVMVPHCSLGQFLHGLVEGKLPALEQHNGVAVLCSLQSDDNPGWARPNDGQFFLDADVFAQCA